MSYTFIKITITTMYVRIEEYVDKFNASTTLKLGILTFTVKQN